MWIKKSGIGFMFMALSVFISQAAMAQDKENEKIKASIEVLDSFGEMEENIPSQLLSISQGIIIVPKMINAGLMIGGKRGKGIAMIKKEDGSWSDPIFVTITGGSVGAQIGVQATDLILVFKNSKTLREIGKGSFTLGGDLSVAAGPVGRSSSAQTDYKLEAEVYSYSRSKGLFAGITLNGAVLAVDAKADEAFYGTTSDAHTILTSSNNDSALLVDLKERLQGLNQ